MNRKKVIKHMMAELNFYVKHYDACKDAEVKAEWQKDFEQHVKVFNGLLREMFPTVDSPSFRRSIEKYKEDRGWRYE